METVAGRHKLTEDVNFGFVSRCMAQAIRRTFTTVFLVKPEFILGLPCITKASTRGHPRQSSAILGGGGFEGGDCGSKGLLRKDSNIFSEMARVHL